jgi:2-methylfumaryl-CoA isomerase
MMLDGLQVVEVASFVAGPLGGMTLAQLGADVIRVDPLGGAADTGRWPLSPSGTSLFWTAMNKGKRSVVADFRSAAGRDVITRLIARAGIVITNAPGRGWLSYETLAQQRPDLIHVQIDGYRDGRPAVDYTVNAQIGFPLVTGPPELAGPVGHVLPAWDIACGLHAAVGVLAADRQRARSGQGARIHLPLFDVALALTGHLGLLAEAQLGRERERTGNWLYGGFGRDFVLADGERVMVVALTARHFAGLAQATGLETTMTDLARLLGADFALDGDRYRHREALAAVLSPWFAERTCAEVAQALDGTGVLWSRYGRFTDLDLDHPMLTEIDQPGVGAIRAPASPLDLGEPRAAHPAPRLGQHTDEVVTALGLDAAALREQGAIAG